MTGTYALKVKMDLGNAAFDGELLPIEVATILRDLATDIEGAARSMLHKRCIPLRDVNGNKIGEAEFGDILSDEGGG